MRAARRAVRGGSFNGIAEDVRSASREGFDSGLRLFNGLGCRVVVAPFSL